MEMFRKTSQFSSKTFLGCFGLLYLCGVFYFLHVAFHDRTEYDSEFEAADDADSVALGIGVVPPKLKFSSREALMAFRYKRYERAKRRPQRDGPGEMGKPVILTVEEQREADRLFAKETFNVVASNKVAMDRSIHDTRHPEYASLIPYWWQAY